MQTLLSACASANEASKRHKRVSASLQTNLFQSTGRRSREETRKFDGGMAPTAGVSRSEAKVPENLRAVSHHGQPMQAQASRESGRSRLPSRGRHGDAGIVERTAAQMPGNGEHQPLESNGWCRPHDEPACEPAWPKGSASHPSLVGKGDGAEREAPAAAMRTRS